METTCRRDDVYGPSRGLVCSLSTEQKPSQLAVRESSQLHYKCSNVQLLCVEELAEEQQRIRSYK